MCRLGVGGGKDICIKNIHKMNETNFYPFFSSFPSCPSVRPSASAWTQLDASNMASVASGLASSRTTDLATEVTQLWQILGKLCMVCIALSTINFVLCIAASDLDFNEWSIDTDKLTMLTSGVLSAIGTFV